MNNEHADERVMSFKQIGIIGKTNHLDGVF